MATQDSSTQIQEMDIFAGLKQEAQSKTKLAGLQQKADLITRTNQDYAEQFKQGTAQVLAGGKRQTTEAQGLDEQIRKNKDFISYVGQTVDFLTNEFGQIETYLGKITKGFDASEQAMVDKADKLEQRAATPFIGWFINKEKVKLEAGQLRKQADTTRTERILQSSLEENITTIMGYYKSIKDVMYKAAIANTKSELEITAQRDITMKKLTENEKQYDLWVQKKNTAAAELTAIEAELVPLTGEIRTTKEKERLAILDRVNKAQEQEDIYFSVMKNARDDLKYQEQILGNFRDTVKGIKTAIVDMEQKIDNRTVLFQNFEVAIKTVYQVKSYGSVDRAMNQTLAKGAMMVADSTAATLGELGQRAAGKPMSPDEFKAMVEGSRRATAEYNATMDKLKADYATPGS